MMSDVKQIPPTDSVHTSVLETDDLPTEVLSENRSQTSTGRPSTLLTAPVSVSASLLASPAQVHPTNHDSSGRRSMRRSSSIKVPKAFEPPSRVMHTSSWMTTLYTTGIKLFRIHLPNLPKSPEVLRTMPLRQRLNFYLTQPRESLRGWVFHRCIMLLLSINCMLMAIETCDGPRFNSSQPAYSYLPGDTFFMSTEVILTLIYIVEFCMRCSTARNQKIFWMMKTTWIECIAWMPLLIYQVCYTLNKDNPSFDAMEVRATINFLRIARALRIIIMSHVFDGAKIMFRAIQQSVAPLKITFFFLITVVMVFATAIFYAEPCYDLHTCTFTDIFNAGYFVMVTVATVGYGSQIPSIYNGGSMFLAGVVMIFGSLYLAMPLAIIGIRYDSAWREYEGTKRSARLTTESFGKASVASSAAVVSVQNEDEVGDLSLQPLESRQVYSVSYSICDRFYEISQRMGYVDFLIQRVIKEPDGTTADTAFQRAKARNDTTVKILECIMGILKVHKKVCTEIRGMVPNNSERAAKASASPTRPSVIRLSITARSASFTKSTSNVFNRLRRALSSREPRSVRLQHVGTPTWRSKVWDILEYKNTTRQATLVNTARLYIVLLSIALFYAQTTPELQETGLRSTLCHRSIEDFCTKKSIGFYDQPGCFVVDENNVVTTTRLDFRCTDNPLCYGYGKNYGSDTFASTCSKAFGKKGVQRVCNSRLCKPPVAFWLNMEPAWVYFEFFFNIVFSAEVFLRIIVHPQRKTVWKDIPFILDLLVLLPFYSEVVQILGGRMPIYSVVPSAPSFTTYVRVLKTFRILKLGPYIAGSEVLARTAFLVYKRLMIPLFFLFIGCVICGAVFSELERGTECFVGQECMYWGKSVLTPEIAGDLPIGKRILVQNTQPSTITDMLRSTWFALVTITTVGYGDFVPRTPFGRVFDIFTMIMSACYTAMPLTLVGGQFYVCYEVYVRDQKRNAVRGPTKPDATVDSGGETSHEVQTNVADVPLMSLSGAAAQHADVLGALHRDSSVPQRPEISPVEMQILNQFILMHKVLTQVIEDLSRLNRLGSRRFSVKKPSSSPSSNSDDESITLRQTEQEVEHLITENMGFCVTVFLNFAPVIEKIVGVQVINSNASSKPSVFHSAATSLHIGGLQNDTSQFK